MDDLLPSYESALEQNPWIHIAKYLPSESLCSAALVCRKWHTIMVPELWGKPASHFGVQNDTVYVALTRFKQTLPYVRPFVRALTHTLEFPPAHAELYGGPHAEWLRNCLEYLPRLQCLKVNGLPFFDHGALLSLRFSSPRFIRGPLNVFPSYGLRLLDASACTNATSTGLAEALSHFPDLISLDLSRTMAARDDLVLKKLHSLRRLRVLSLQGLALKDSDFAIVAQCIGTRVRSLDICDNNLTDTSARTLLEYCVKEPHVDSHIEFESQAHTEIDQSDQPSISTIQGSLVGHLRKKLTSGFAGSLAIEEARDVGITQLYLSNNIMSVEGISGLLRSRRIQVLDIGILPCMFESLSPHPTNDGPHDMRLPSVSKLTNILKDSAASKLEYLRINYQLVTEDCPSDIASSPRAELPGSLGVYASPDAQELEALETPTPELDSAEVFIAELPDHDTTAAELPTSRSGSPVSSVPAIERGSDEVPQIKLTEEPKFANSGPAFAPEPVHPNALPSLVGLRSHNQHSDCDGLIVSPTFDLKVTSHSTSQKSGRHNSMYFVEDRRARLNLRQSQENRLHPGMIPKVHTLVLTDVPPMTDDKQLVHRIVKYVEDAAEEAAIARERARHTYMLPPGRARATAEKEYAHSLFGLRRIVLEMATPRVGPRKAVNGWRAYPTKSSTEDADSEAFWEAATNDFSFFDEEECGIPAADSRRLLLHNAVSGLEVVPSSVSESADSPMQATFASNAQIDVIAEIGKFRRDRKAAFDNLVQMEELEPEVQGYWPGDITILRKSLDTEDGELDCYGNRYQAGWYYR